MAKAIINPGNLRKQHPSGEHITKIMYDDNEPPKNYIWGKPDGFLYVWNGVKWVLLNDKSQKEQHIPFAPAQKPIDTSQFINKNDLDAKLKALKVEIITYLTKLINMKDCATDSGVNAIQWFRESVLPDINDLKDASQTHVTRDELNDAIENVASSDAIGNINSNITNINNNITNIEGDITNIEGDITEIQGDIDTINNNITNINSDITTLDSRIDENEEIVSAALNDLNDRLDNIGDTIQIDTSMFVTAQEVQNISSVQL